MLGIKLMATCKNVQVVERSWRKTGHVNMRFFSLFNDPINSGTFALGTPVMGSRTKVHTLGVTLKYYSGDIHM